MRSNLSEANLSDANASKAELARANLQGALLADTDLSYANLARANLTGAVLTATDFTGAYTLLTHFEDSDLSQAVGLKQDQIDIACGNDGTVLPEGLTRPRRLALSHRIGHSAGTLPNVLRARPHRHVYPAALAVRQPRRRCTAQKSKAPQATSSASPEAGRGLAPQVADARQQQS